MKKELTIKTRTVAAIGTACALFAINAIKANRHNVKELHHFQQREKNLKTMLANSDAMADRSLEWFEEEFDRANRLEVEVYELTGRVYDLENELDDFKMNSTTQEEA